MEYLSLKQRWVVVRLVHARTEAHAKKPVLVQLCTPTATVLLDSMVSNVKTVRFFTVIFVLIRNDLLVFSTFHMSGSRQLD